VGPACIEQFSVRRAEPQRHPHDVVFENRLAIVSDRDRPRAL
jgi:hypothetical protein